MTLLAAQRQLQRWLPYIVVAACSLGMAPTNAALVLSALVVIYATRKQRPAVAHLRPLVWGVGIYLSTRLLCTVLSPDVTASLRHLAKDWRLVALAAGLIVGFSRHRAGDRFFITVLAALTAYAMFDFVGAGGEWRYIQRTAGFMSSPLTLAGVAMLLLFFVAKPVWQKGTSAIVAGLASLVLLVTVTRGAWLGAIGGGLVFSCFDRQRRRLGFAILAGALAIGALTPAVRERALSSFQQVDAQGIVGHRFTLWKGAIAMAERSPVFGVGPGRFRAEIDPYIPYEGHARGHAHSIYFHALAEGGGIGLLGVFALFFGIVVNLLQQRPPGFAAGLGATAAMLTAGLSELTLYDGEVASLYFFLIGCILHRAPASQTDATVTSASHVVP